jgi:hypothetical protein
MLGSGVEVGIGARVGVVVENLVAVAVLVTTSEVIATNSWVLVGGVGKHEATNIARLKKQNRRFFAFMAYPFM